MTEAHIRETCSCGATIDVTGGRYRADRNPNSPRGAEEAVERWRTDHRHEFPPQPEPTPEPQHETQLDALVDMAHPRSADMPAFGFQPRITEEDE